ncbi:MAG: GNAT family N-acetyltransferase [Candidatus Thorarchaeota archaeon]
MILWNSSILLRVYFISEKVHITTAMYEIRSLRLSDREDILEIARHIWEGHDYIPYLFDTWLNDRHSYTAAIEQDSHVVALANLRVIENGKTGWMEGLRVHPDYRGRGFAKLLTQHVVQMAKEIPVERIRYTTAADNESSLHLGESVGMRRKFDLAVHWQDIDNEISWSVSQNPVREVSVAELYPRVLNTELFPHNIIIYDWKALDVTRESLEKIGKDSRFWMQIMGDEIVSISLGLTREDQSGSHWSFSIYAKDGSTFLDQLAHQVKMTFDTGCKSFFVTYQTDFVESLYSLDWVKRYDDDSMTLTLLERTF